VPAVFGYHEEFHAFVVAAADVSLRGDRGGRAGIVPA
jgi:hypothetical protein